VLVDADAIFLARVADVTSGVVGTRYIGWLSMSSSSDPAHGRAENERQFLETVSVRITYAPRAFP
jgi:hypothetical protein